MNEDEIEQLRLVCEWNRRLARDNALLRVRLRSTEVEIRELEEARTDLQAQLSAADALVGSAVDEALKVRRP
jgi:hypothetical protein